MASATLVKRIEPMPVIMPVVERSATASAGQRKLRSTARALPRSRKTNRAMTAEPENNPRQNSMVIRSALISRVNRPDDDQAKAARATRARPRRWFFCSAAVMGEGLD